MSINNFTVSQATKPQLDEVLTWLKLEHDEKAEGFYCNREIISYSFSKKEMLCLLKGAKTIGFVVFSIGKLYASIDIIEIHPDHRDCSNGTKLVLNLIDQIYSAGCKSVTVKCAPKSSHGFWRKLGFVETTPSTRYCHQGFTAPELYMKLDLTSHCSTLN